ncbi:MAG: hypothetical protein JST90_14675 [Bacteroidetes bacterium]|nr:hypothetical protein [Bacteroidota bacterium]
MAQTASTYERGFNMGYYLEAYAPHILSRAMDGLSHMPPDFLLGLKHGQVQGRTNKKLETTVEREAAAKRKAADDREYYRQRAEERRREVEYKQQLRRDEQKKRRRNDEIDSELVKDFKTDPYERRMKELAASRRSAPDVPHEQDQPDMDTADGQAEKSEAPISSDPQDSQASVPEVLESGAASTSPSAEDASKDEPAAEQKERAGEISEIREQRGDRDERSR